MEEKKDLEDLLGKKVFFLYPPSVIQNEMVAELYKNEYEVYLLKSHEDAKRLLNKYPNSILFINIDDGLKETEWERYIKDIQEGPNTKDVRIGIMSYNNDPGLAQKYLLDMAVTAGFIKLSIGLKESTNIVLKTLEANEAKGRRKYVRATVITNATLIYQNDAGKFTATLLDMSSAGFAAIFQPDPGFKVHSLLRDVQLRLKGVLASVNCIMMGSRKDANGNMVYILLFDPKTEQEARQKIRTFINHSLQNTIQEEAKAL